MSPEKHDDLYARQREQIEAFRFDEKVADVFEDMIQRSVPGYRDIVTMTGVLAQEYFRSGTQCYDLGCSLGAVTAEILKRVDDAGRTVIAVDKSEAMAERCRGNLAGISAKTTVRVECADIRDIVIKNASFVVLNFVLQFLEPADRQQVLKGIAGGLAPGGVLILSEKIKFADAREDAFQTRLHHTFKKLNGYSDMEISQKRTALENVLVPDAAENHIQHLKAAGFGDVSMWFRCFNFVSLIAFKA